MKKLLLLSFLLSLSEICSGADHSGESGSAPGFGFDVSESV